MRIGIFFGGPSREREISFAGGRTVYDNLDKSLFEPVPIFVDSLKNFILLDWKYIYKGSIRDFYPPVDHHPDSPHGFQIYVESLGTLPREELEEMASKVGRLLRTEELPQLMDFAFLALHGRFGEDGEIQGLLETLEIPYSGSGILPSAIGISKAVQKEWMTAARMPHPEWFSIKRVDWKEDAAKDYFEKTKKEIGFPCVIRPSEQGSSIGVSILQEADEKQFSERVNAAFFIRKMSCDEWRNRTSSQRIDLVESICDIREGLGLPLKVNGLRCEHPEDVLLALETHFERYNEPVVLTAEEGEPELVIESFIRGREFSCIVLRNETPEKQMANGEPIALPPTEILKNDALFDYRSKYLAGLARKVTPIDISAKYIEKIRDESEKLFRFFRFNTYARIDGFIRENGTVFLNDPNTTSGMLPSSFFFHQAAEIGLTPAQFLTYIIRTSLAERLASGARYRQSDRLLPDLDRQLSEKKAHSGEKIRVAVIMGGYSSERHISVESGRNIFEKLASSGKYEPIPVFLSGDDRSFRLHVIPVNLLLKDNADDIREKIEHFEKHPVIESIKEECRWITKKYARSDYRFEPVEISIPSLAEAVDFAFIALHGRPGEDGRIQVELEKYGIPYNGSGPASSQITIDKYESNERLRQAGMKVAHHRLVNEEEWTHAKNELLDAIESDFAYPFIAKPVDDGCSSAVKKIENRKQLEAYGDSVFRKEWAIGDGEARILKLKSAEEFPQKERFLIEELIGPNGADRFMEVTGGMLIETDEEGYRHFEVFEPSESLASDAVLSLEEKFLAGEGQNITPARFGTGITGYEKIASKVKSDLQKVAEILDVEGYCRIDAFVRVFNDGRVETVIIEVNSLPGMTPATCIFHQAALNDYKPYQFIDRIIELGMKRNKRKFADTGSGR